MAYYSFRRHSSKIYLLIIIVIAIFFRFYNFPNNPPGLNWDEVSIGYNAHSILLTGKDEFGNHLPLYFRSLDDYKQPVQIYLVAISEKIFGYNDFAVRFPSAFFGILSVLFIYLLTFEITKRKWASLLASLIFAVLPWSVQFSRYALEANIGLSLLILSIVLYLKSFKNKKLLPLSIILFGVTSYTYLSYKVTAPLTIFGLFFIYRKNFDFKSKISRISLILFFLLCALITRDFMNKNGQVRFGGTSVLNDVKTFRFELNETQYEGTLKINLPRRFFHEIPQLTNAGLITRGYLTAFSPKFLFFDRGQKFHFAPNVGLLYIWMLPFIIFGMHKIFQEKEREKFVILLLFLIAPIPASVTYDVPHAIRVFLLSVPFAIFAGIGIEFTYLEFIKRRKIFGTIFVILIFSIGFMYSWQFFRQYQIHLPHERSKQWQYGRAQMAEYLFAHQKDYKKIIVSTDLEWPNIFMLYYGGYNPAKYLAQGGTISGSWAAEDNKFDNFYFHKFQNLNHVYAKDVFEDNVLLVGKPSEFPKEVSPIKIINYLDGTSAIYMVKSENMRAYIPH